ncbi:hypothetical protein GOV04_02970 [Candidatus Woesearchaeota archaeon]|nr:hypothetical protein [Candidatus Woesearchaeota archaeon]
MEQPTLNKNSIKKILFNLIHSFALYLLFLITGMIFYYLGKKFSAISYSILPKTIIALIVIPFLYSLFVKKNIKEWLLIVFLLVLMSSTISLNLMNSYQEKIVETRARNESFIIKENVFATNSASLIVSTACYSYNVRSINAGPDQLENKCFFYKMHKNISIVLSSIVSFSLIILSVILGNFLRFRKKEPGIVT